MDDYTNDVKDIGADTKVEGVGQLGMDHPAAYRPDAGLVAAVNVALVLNRPLLLTGEPGTGKTQLAYSLAWQLAGRGRLNIKSARVEKFETKSTSVAKDLFYSFDVLGRFHAAHHGGSAAGVDYITLNALGRAIVEALPAEQVKSVLPAGHAHQGPRRSIVLIDEIDKAPRDFPNDLLNEIDHMYFRIPELGNVMMGGPGLVTEAMKPIVVITSNSEKQLPQPFLRRCIYYNIGFPDRLRLEEILLSRLGHRSLKQGALVDDALEFFLRLREQNVTQRKISPAELIQWVTYLLASGVTPRTPLRAAKEQARKGLAAIAKNEADQERFAEELQSFLGDA